MDGSNEPGKSYNQRKAFKSRYEEGRKKFLSQYHPSQHQRLAVRAMQAGLDHARHEEELDERQRMGNLRGSNGASRGVPYNPLNLAQGVKEISVSRRTGRMDTAEMRPVGSNEVLTPKPKKPKK